MSIENNQDKDPSFSPQKETEPSVQGPNGDQNSDILFPRFGEPDWKSLDEETDYDVYADRLRKLDPDSSEEVIQKAVEAKIEFDKRKEALKDAKEMLEEWKSPPNPNFPKEPN